jgi:hypothetical protein
LPQSAETAQLLDDRIRLPALRPTRERSATERSSTGRCASDSVVADAIAGSAPCENAIVRVWTCPGVTQTGASPPPKTIVCVSGEAAESVFAALRELGQ